MISSDILFCLSPVATTKLVAMALEIYPGVPAKLAQKRVKAHVTILRGMGWHIQRTGGGFRIDRSHYTLLVQAFCFNKQMQMTPCSIPLTNSRPLTPENVRSELADFMDQDDQDDQLSAL